MTSTQKYAAEHLRRAWTALIYCILKALGEVLF